MPLVAVVALVAASCGGADDTTVSGETGTAARTPVSTQEGSAPASNNADTAEGEPEEVDRLQALTDRSDASAEISIAGGGRLVVGVTCLDGHATPTALVEAQGIDIAAGQHKAEVEPFTGGPEFIVIDTDQPGLPAFGASSARQTGFEAASYTISFPSLGDDVLFELPGCS